MMQCVAALTVVFTLPLSGKITIHRWTPWFPQSGASFSEALQSSPAVFAQTMGIIRNRRLQTHSDAMVPFVIQLSLFRRGSHRTNL